MAVDLVNSVIIIGRAIYYWILSIGLFLVPRNYRVKDVSNDIVLITGGGSGLGRALAVRFAKRKAKIILWDINEKGLVETQQMIEEIGGQCKYYICDISQSESVYDVASRVQEDIGPVTILINNAGIVSGKKFLHLQEDQIVKTFEVNTLAHFWTVRSFLPAMILQSKGHIVTIASFAGLTGSPSLTDYCGSKAAAVGFHESLSLESAYSGHPGIHYTLVCPYFINTGMFDGVNASGLLPMLDQQTVAREIELGILTNQEMIILPRLLYLTYILKACLPCKVFTTLSELAGSEHYMTNFVGRHKLNGLSNGVKL